MLYLLILIWQFHFAKMIPCLKIQVVDVYQHICDVVISFWKLNMSCLKLSILKSEPMSNMLPHIKQTRICGKLCMFQMRYTQKVSVWPVGLVAKLRYEAPIVRNRTVCTFVDVCHVCNWTIFAICMFVYLRIKIINNYHALPFCSTVPNRNCSRIYVIWKYASYLLVSAYHIE